MRSGQALMAIMLVASLARAESVGTEPAGGSTDRRLYGVVGMRSIKGGLVSVGGSSLRFLATGSRRWETLHTVPGDSLYRVAADDSGRLLAAWEKERIIHVFTPGQQQPVSFPMPLGPPDLERPYQIASFEFLPNGRDAVLYMTSTVKVTTGRNRGPSWSTAAFRIALDGKSEAELLFRVDHGYRLHTSRRGAVFAMNKYPGRQCDHGECLISAIVAYELTESGVRQTILVDGSELSLSRARLIRGSDGERVALMLDVSKPKSLGLMRWRHGDEKADFRTVPWPENEALETFFLNKAGELIEFRGRDKLIEVWRHSPKGEERLASLRALQNIDTGIYGVGDRGDGSLWLHWGDHLALLSPGKPPRSYNLLPLLPRRYEWAGAAIYVQSPEQLWVGIDGRGRYYERVDFTTVEKHSKVWR